LYSRFWQKFLFDKGVVPVDEYAKKLINQGMILGTSAFVYRVEGENKFVSKGLTNGLDVQSIHADVSFVNSSDELDIEAFKNWREEFKDAEFVLEDGVYKVGRDVEKMSKSKYNVVNPDQICVDYGADSLRLYEMFLGPLEQYKPWNTAGITGVHGFLKKLWKLYVGENGLNVNDTKPNADNLKTLHKTIKKVEEDIENFSFNTSVSTFMIAVNELTAQKCTSKEILEPLLIVLSPYAPHIAEELWNQLGHNTSISTAPFPKFDARHLVESSKNYPISFNGKMRFTLELSMDFNAQQIEEAVMAHEKTKEQLAGRTPKKVIIVPGKIVNIVG
jgi:leucyl-tRNA synthetase